MALFGRKPKPRFWLAGRDYGEDPRALYSRGLQYVQRDEYRGMIAVGWQIMRVAGLHVEQSRDFLQDGFSGLQYSSEFDATEGRVFLTALLNVLEDPAVVANHATADAQSDYFVVRCWAAMNHFNLLDDREQDDHREALFQALTGEPQSQHLTIAARQWVHGYRIDKGEI